MERFVASDTPSNEGMLGPLLLESSWGDIAISELDKSLRTAKQVPQSIYRVLALLLADREFRDKPLPDVHQTEKRQLAIHVRGDRLRFILAELYLIRPVDGQPGY